MWGRKCKGETARDVDARSKENARSAEEARSESARLADTARPVQQALRDQLERNHWAELIFGRLN
ncbi:hypothetical protein SEA_TWISTER6_44 [Gordonia phage Twister6]|uniref:Uncharacterized protein n=11 Tax=Wizardvirus TaxID=2169658 RepID=A0A7D5G1H5_9CAUD|nr:hypothetical protein BH794_gp41 [Gordonia phage Wizard]YP_009284815.1 hypothetical protein BI083_gp44 [Gordonia phage Twister6]YP_010096649.1 hypothetical protein KNT95_gp44 [Gordonia phage Danyall]YP_010096743.1 hypothetical protein KNT96_gp43 [Gordonia phage KimmyK]YP_010102102.1 hypothetical protein KNU54_gp45 [Gordonia phage VanDeWege]YP_010102296.1 hypothetical protein KNU56_gp45 [Gordonia phage Arri]YP_010102389.1 hypothetical protein KNU57_gp44 [Gordonia phage Valary]YP_010103055.1